MNAEKPDLVVMMLGAGDRRGIRETIRQQPARPPAGQKQDQAKQASQGQRAGRSTGGAAQQAQARLPPPPQKPVEAKRPPQQDTAQDQEQPSAMAPEGPVAGTVVHEFRSENGVNSTAARRGNGRRVESERRAGVLGRAAAVRGSRATSEMVYLNDIYRARAEKAGIVYIESGTASSTTPAITTITAPTSRDRRVACAPVTVCISPAPARASWRIISSAKCAA